MTLYVARETGYDLYSGPISAPYKDIVSPIHPGDLVIVGHTTGMTITASGFPDSYAGQANWFTGPSTLRLRWAPYPVTPGTYPITISSPGEPDISLSIRAINYATGSTIFNCFPHVFSGGIDGFYNRDAGIKHRVVSGTISLGVVITEDDWSQSSIGGDNTSTRPTSAFKFRLWLVRYGASDVAISGVMSGTDTVSFDSTAYADGQYVISIEPLDGDLYLTHPWNLILTIDNNATAITSTQKLAAVGTRGTYCQWHLPGGRRAVDWVDVAGWPTQASTGYPYELIAAPADSTARNALIPISAWVCEPTTKTYSYREEVDTLLEKTPQGHRYINGQMWKGQMYYDGGAGQNLTLAKQWIGWDGPRNNNSVNNMTHYTPDLDSSDWIGVEPSGRVVRVTRGGTVTTIFGQAKTSGQIHYRSDDASGAQLSGEKTTFLGTYDSLLATPWDLAFSPTNHNHLFICDLDNHRIAKIDFSVNPPVLSTFAGAVGVSGFTNHSTPTSARFNLPISLCFDDSGNMYVADRGNFAIRKIATDGTVTTVVGNGAAGMPDRGTLYSNIVAAGGNEAFTPATVTMASNPNIYYPCCVRLDSQGRIIVSEGSTLALRAIDVNAGTVDKVLIVSTFGNGDNWFDIDRLGIVGPIDDILCAEAQVGGQFARYSIDGSRRASVNDALFVLLGNPGGTYNSGYGAYGSHSLCWSVRIHSYTSAIAVISYHRQGLATLRPKRASGDVHTSQVATGNFTNGLVVAAAGTSQCLPFDATTPGLDPNSGSVAMGLRPSLTRVHGASGHGFTAPNSTYDDLSAMSDADLAAYIRAGAGGTVPRPEISGVHLRDLIYHIRCMSVSGHFTLPSLSTIASNLQTAGLHNISDTAKPVISNVVITSVNTTTKQVTWTTDKPCIGIVQYGKTEMLGQFSAIESSLSTSHDVTVDGLLPGDAYYFRVRQQDLSGNWSISSEYFVDQMGAVEDDDTVEGIITLGYAGEAEYSGDIVEDDDTVAATANVSIAGACDITEDDDTVAGTIELGVIATAEYSGDIVEDDDTVAATYVSSMSYTANITEDDDSVSATMTYRTSTTQIYVITAFVRTYI